MATAATTGPSSSSSSSVPYDSHAVPCVYSRRLRSLISRSDGQDRHSAFKFGSETQRRRASERVQSDEAFGRSTAAIGCATETPFYAAERRWSAAARRSILDPRPPPGERDGLRDRLPHYLPFDGRRPSGLRDLRGSVIWRLRDDLARKGRQSV